MYIVIFIILTLSSISCINQGSDNTSNYQSAQNTYNNNSGLKTEIITLDRDIDTFINKSVNLLDKCDKISSDIALLKKHPAFSEVEEKFNKYNIMSFVEEDNDRKIDMEVEFLSTLSVDENKVYKKWIALATKQDEYTEEAKDLDDEIRQLSNRYASLRMRVDAGIRNGSISSLSGSLELAANKLDRLMLFLDERNLNTSK